jgi:hypothetical protein
LATCDTGYRAPCSFGTRQGNVVQIEANRRNAKDGTQARPYPQNPAPAISTSGQGPRTEIGKKTSSLNALRHGLIARVVVLPAEDLEIHATLTAAAVYREHSQAFVNLSMHEQRLHRVLRDATKALEGLKAKHIAARLAALEQHNLNKMLSLQSEPL